MGTYYDYEKRPSEEQINWAVVGKGITEDLSNQAKVREAKKQAIDDASREAQSILKNAPMGEDQNSNAWTLGYADDVSQVMLMQDRLLKSGKMKLKDYLTVSQNSKDGTAQLFDLKKDYNERYATATERRRLGESSAFETQNLGMIEGFANFNETKPIINATDGTVSLAMMKKNKDGVYEVDPDNNKHLTVQQAKSRISTNINKYKANDDLANEVKLQGNTIKALATMGGTTVSGLVKSVSSPFLMQGLDEDGKMIAGQYIKAEDAMLEAKLADPANVSSICADWLGSTPDNKPYRITYDEKDAANDPSAVLYNYKNGPIGPDFTTENGKKQRELAKEFLKTKFRSMLDYEEKIDPFNPPKQTELEVVKGDNDKRMVDAGNMLAKFYGGTDKEVETAADNFYGKDKIERIERDEKGAIIYFKDGTNKALTFVDANGNPVGKDSFVEGAATMLVGEDVDLKLIKKGALGVKGDVLNKTRLSRTMGAKKDYVEEVANYATENVSKSINPKDAGATASALSKKFSKLGFTFSNKTDSSWFGAVKERYITITSPPQEKGKVYTQEIRIDDGDPSGQIEGFINKWKSTKRAESFFTDKEMSTSSTRSTGSAGGAPRPIK